MLQHLVKNVHVKSLFFAVAAAFGAQASIAANASSTVKIENTTGAAVTVSVSDARCYGGTKATKTIPAGQSWGFTALSVCSNHAFFNLEFSKKDSNENSVANMGIDREGTVWQLANPNPYSGELSGGRYQYVYKTAGVAEVATLVRKMTALIEIKTGPSVVQTSKSTEELTNAAFQRIRNFSSQASASVSVTNGPVSASAKYAEQRTNNDMNSGDSRNGVNTGSVSVVNIPQGKVAIKTLSVDLMKGADGRYFLKSTGNARDWNVYDIDAIGASLKKYLIVDDQVQVLFPDAGIKAIQQGGPWIVN